MRPAAAPFRKGLTSPKIDCNFQSTNEGFEYQEKMPVLRVLYVAEASKFFNYYTGMRDVYNARVYVFKREHASTTAKRSPNSS
jgi:hypothetical protein